MGWPRFSVDQCQRPAGSTGTATPRRAPVAARRFGARHRSNCPVPGRTAPRRAPRRCGPRRSRPPRCRPRRWPPGFRGLPTRAEPPRRPALDRRGSRFRPRHRDGRRAEQRPEERRAAARCFAPAAPPRLWPGR